VLTLAVSFNRIEWAGLNGDTSLTSGYSGDICIELYFVRT
jgi:hypothetical protein